MDARTGEVLSTDNADVRLHPASLTKMMTLYIAFEAIERGEVTLDTMVRISSHAAAEPPSKLGLRAGQKIALRYLIRAAAVKSANDAATAIGEAISGSEAAFARRMNRTAQALGMSRTTFKNANGLTEAGHLSTARDMATLGRRVFYDYPQYYNLFSRRSANAGVAEVANTNRRFLDAYEGADGIKTGYTSAAGFNLVASAQRGDKRIITAVFGGQSTAARNARVAELMDLGFGRAPKRARVASLPAPAYGPDGAPDTVAVAVAEAVANGEPSTDLRAAGKTLRFSGSVLRSPRPKARPGVTPEVEEVLIAAAPAIAAGVEIALAEALPELVAEPEAAIADAAAVAPTDAPDPAAVTVVAALDATLRPEPRPVTDVQDAEAVAAVEIEEVAAAPVSAEAAPLALPASQIEPAPAPLLVAEALPATDPLASTPPEARPMVSTKAPAGLDLAAVQPVPAPLTRAAMDHAAAPELIAAVPLAPLPEAEEPIDPLAEAVALAVAEAMAPEGATRAPEPEIAEIAPEADPGPVILLAAALPSQTETAPQEIVTRLSTSDVRLFGINVGSYPSRFEAERVLLKTALTEIAALSDSRRKVMPRQGGFEATFVGLSEQSAALACRRLSARGGDCTVIVP